jgi:hypothetical protein
VLWVVILLTDGVPNAGYSDDNQSYYCPSTTWGLSTPCNNQDAKDDWVKSTRPASTDLDPIMYPSSTGTPPYYDALAYAFDEADFVGLPFDSTTNTGGQGALIYTIGLGPQVDSNPVTGFTDTVFDKGKTVSGGLGAVFLQYASKVGRGLYYYAPNGSQLDTIFREIGGNIATRLAK